MASKRCPRCGLVNPATAERCDCGRSFVDGSQGPSLGQRLAKPGVNDDELRRKADAALRRARGWILAVGILMFVVDQVVVELVYGGYISDAWKLKLILADTAILAFFVAMYVVARTRPLAACIASLCGFWTIHLILAMINPATLAQGIVVKILFTGALLGGIRSANEAERLRRDLGEVFR